MQPAIDTPEVHAITDHADRWIDDHIFVTLDASLPALIRDAGAELIGYRQLRAAMRAD